MGSVSRNAPCPCGSGRKVKRCCADVTPAAVARTHDAVGGRLQTWAFERYPDELSAALREITGGRRGLVLGDVDRQLVASWALNDWELPAGGTAAQRYGRREDIDSHERDVARRIAAAWLGLLRVERVMAGSWIDLTDLSSVGEDTVRVLSHGVSRSVQPGELLVGRLMDGPPAKSLWGPLGVLTHETASQLIDLLERAVTALGISDDADRIARAMRAASREITVLATPALHRTPAALWAA